MKQKSVLSLVLFTGLFAAACATAVDAPSDEVVSAEAAQTARIRPFGGPATWCGMASNNQGTYPSIAHSGSMSNSVVPCFGFNPQVACPPGYARLNFFMTSWHADSIADGVTTCVGAPTIVPTGVSSGEWCGLDIANQGNRSSIYLDGSLSGAVRCEGHRPATSCPRGYDSVSFSMTSWHDDSIADTVYSCVRSSAAPGGGFGGPITPLSPRGLWCGASFTNAGTYSSIYGAGAPCMGEDPASRCPLGFHRLQVCMTSWHADSIADCLMTCITD